MVQRIQSIYLLLAGILTSIMLYANLITFTEQEREIYMGAFQLTDNQATDPSSIVPLGGLIAISSLVSFLTVSMYKKRMLQLRMCRYNMILMIGIVALMAFYSYKIISQIDAILSVGFGAIMPLVALILTFLAFRAIRKDEILVKSYDRIR